MRSSACSGFHDWNNADTVSILRAVRAAASPNARLLILETVVPEGDDPHFVKTIDIVMLVSFAGRQRTAEEFRVLLADAGFRLEGTKMTGGELTIFEAVPV